MSGALLAALPALIQGGTSLFNAFGSNNAARKAGKEFGKIQGYGREAYNPFIQQGQQANQQLSPLYQQQATNPVGQYNDILSQYQPSAGYQYKQDKLNQMAHNTAAAGGYAGTGGDIQNRSELFNGLMGEDMQQFLQNIFGIQNQGVQGLQHQGDMGYHAASSLADYLGTAGGRQGGLNAITKDYSNQTTNNGLSSLAGLIGNSKENGLGDLFGGMFGGGAGGNKATPFVDLKSTYSPAFSNGNYNSGWLR